MALNQPLNPTTKKLCFDLSACQPMGTHKHHGGGEYGYIVFKRLVELGNPEDIVVYVNSEAYLPSDIQKILKDKNIAQLERNKISLVDAYKDGKFGKFYACLFSNEYFPLMDICPCLFTIHGSREQECLTDKYAYLYKRGLSKMKAICMWNPLVFRFFWKRKYNETLRKFQHPRLRFVTVSEHTRHSIGYYFPNYDISTIKVRYSPNTSVDISSDKPVKPQDYFLLVGADRWMKNSYRAVKAFDKLVSEHPNFTSDLYLTGIKSDHPILKGLRHPERIKTFGYVERDVLEDLYRNAKAFLYPTLNEGFGYPPLEAMHWGVPVITSALTSIQEVCGNAVLYTNPYSEEEIGLRILMMSDPEINARYRKLAAERYEIVKAKQKSDLDLLVNDILSF